MVNLWEGRLYLAKSSLLGDVPIMLPWPPFSVLLATPKSQLSSQEHVRLMLFFGSRVRCFCMCSSFEHGFSCLGIALLVGQVLQAISGAMRPKAFNNVLVEAPFCVRFREVQPPEYVHLQSLKVTARNILPVPLF
jgi:hypothetical protein